MRIRVENDDPHVQHRNRSLVMLGAVPGLVVGWFALGPVGAVALGLAVGIIVIGLAWSGPRVNLRLLGTSPPPRALLHACASSIDRHSGTLDICTDRVRFTPWRRYESRVRPLDAQPDVIEEVVVFRRDGVPRGCRVELTLDDGSGYGFTAFSSADAVANALAAWTHT